MNKVKNVFMLMFLFLSTEAFSKTKSMYFTLDVNYSIRTESASGKMIRLNPGRLSEGQVVKIDDMNEDDIFLNSDGSINEFETLQNYKERKALQAKPYGKNGNEEIFMPVTIYNNKGEELKFESTPEIALLHAAISGKVNAVDETKLKTNFLLSVSPENRVHYVDYGLVNCGKEDVMESFLAFEMPKYFKDISTMPKVQCTEDIKSNGALCLYPKAKIFQSYANQGRKGKNKCYSRINRQSCDSDFWKGLELDQRINHTISTSRDLLQGYNINPFVAPCLTSKETTFESSTIRTKVACDLKKGTPTALGAFQINFPTLQDMVQRGLFNLSASKKNKTPKNVIDKLKPFLKKHLTKASFALLTDSGMAVRSRKRKADVKQLSNELYNLMTISWDLQVALFGTVLKAKNYSFYHYYGAKNDSSANAKYAKRVSQCLSCMHERAANRNESIHSCVALSKGSKYSNIEKGYKAIANNVKNFQKRNCDEDYSCLKNTCYRDK